MTIIEVAAPGVVSRIRKARTEHRCSDCGSPIRPGSEYREDSWGYGRFERRRVCWTCHTSTFKGYRS